MVRHYNANAISINCKTMKKSIIAAAIMAALCFATNVSAQTDQQKKCDGKVQCDKATSSCPNAVKCCKAKANANVDAATSATAQAATASTASCCKEKASKKKAKAQKKCCKKAQKAAKTTATCDKCEKK